MGLRDHTLEQLLDLNPRETIEAAVPSRRIAALHQLLPNLSFGDAISNQAIWIGSNYCSRDIVPRFSCGTWTSASATNAACTTRVLDAEDGCYITTLSVAR